ncbi:hypothetical protein BDW22DRAFT_1429403 [Trametopsis cervina]|nr:hypothetical protein BDW22DRAFT_1429403 [Trametopsis cervina]
MIATPACIRLPREIVDFITEDLKDEKKTLKACCLISRSADIWAASCRAHLFKDITVHVHEPERSLVEFIRFLEAAPFIAEQVERLCLRKTDVYFAQYPLTTSVVRKREVYGTRHPVDAFVVRNLLDKLPRLTQLSLQRLYCALTEGSNVTHADSNVKFKLKILKYRPEITDLAPLDGFLQILALFSEVDELRFQESPLPKCSPPSEGPKINLPKISSLIFEDANHMQALARDILCIASLRTLGMPLALTAASEIEFKAMLTQYGQELCNLQIVLCDLQDTIRQEKWRDMHVDRLTSLKSVTFITSSSLYMYQDRYHLPSITNCLGVVPSAGISQINLIPTVPKYLVDYDHQSWEDWAYPYFSSKASAQFDEVCHKLPSLQKVFWGWTIGHDVEDVDKLQW